MDMHNVFEDDALESSKAITNEVTNPDYDAFFGSIAYDKGGCIIRMIENFMTEDKLNLGVSQYLKKFEYSNAETKDLWEALNDVADPESLPSNLELPEIMSSWTDQPGYPVVEYDGTTLKQERFLLNTTGKLRIYNQFPIDFFFLFQFLFFFLFFSNCSYVGFTMEDSYQHPLPER